MAATTMEVLAAEASPLGDAVRSAVATIERALAFYQCVPCHSAYAVFARLFLTHSHIERTRWP
jgi:hypothetical protein